MKARRLVNSKSSVENGSLGYHLSAEQHVKYVTSHANAGRLRLCFFSQLLRLDGAVAVRNKALRQPPYPKTLSNSESQLSHAGIRYYAGSVLKSDVFHIRRRTRTDRHLHAMAFIAHQFYRLQDNLVDVYLSVLTSFHNNILRQQKEHAFHHQQARDRRIKTLLKNLEKTYSTILQTVKQITGSAQHSDAEKVRRIKDLLARTDGTASLTDLREEADASGTLCYDFVEERAPYLHSRAGRILKALTWQPMPSAYPLREAIVHIEARGGSPAADAPVSFLDPEECDALTREDGSFRRSLYKAFLFTHVSHAIKSGQLNLIHSYKYRSFDAYQISQERWEQEKATLIHQAELQDFQDPTSVLKTLDEALYQHYVTTNHHAKKGENVHLKWHRNGQFYVLTPPLEETNPELFTDIFPQRHDIPLAQILETVHQYSGMLTVFQHWQQTRTNRELPRPYLLAGVIGLGCGIGIREMVRISPDIKEGELEHIIRWWFSLENIQAANDKIIDVMDRMDLPNLYRQSKDRLHTASDGQKFRVRADSLLASRSYKYFGQEQGVSAYTFIDERHLLWHSLIMSASDRESAYVIDGIMQNDAIKSDIHSTDTHGYSEAVFGISHFLGFSFAPRIKNLKKQRQALFRSRKQDPAVKTCSIGPNKYIDEALILENWDNLLRLAATIELKEATASDIFRRLNSYSRQHPLYQSLKAFGQMVKSLFILRYLDDLPLRQAIERQLNKVELSHRFTRAVAVGSPREFAQGDKDDLEITESCNRLIKNSTICWNYLYLTHKLHTAQNQEEKDRLTQAIMCHSPISWAHINMLGEYDFSEEKLRDSEGIIPMTRDD